MLVDHGKIAVKSSGLLNVQISVVTIAISTRVLLEIIKNIKSAEIVKMIAWSNRKLNNVGEVKCNHMPCNTGVRGPYCAKNSLLGTLPSAEASAAVNMTPSWCGSGSNLDIFTKNIRFVIVIKIAESDLWLSIVFTI